MSKRMVQDQTDELQMTTVPAIFPAILGKRCGFKPEVPWDYLQSDNHRVGFDLCQKVPNKPHGPRPSRNTKTERVLEGFAAIAVVLRMLKSWLLGPFLVPCKSAPLRMVLGFLVCSSFRIRFRSSG